MSGDKAAVPNAVNIRAIKMEIAVNDRLAA
jgi:hypothetical protein